LLMLPWHTCGALRALGLDEAWHESKKHSPGHS
jgi:hypothetical protein